MTHRKMFSVIPKTKMNKPPMFTFVYSKKHPTGSACRVFYYLDLGIENHFFLRIQ